MSQRRELQRWLDRECASNAVLSLLGAIGLVACSAAVYLVFLWIVYLALMRLDLRMPVFDEIVLGVFGATVAASLVIDRLICWWLNRRNKAINLERSAQRAITYGVGDWLLPHDGVDFGSKAGFTLAVLFLGHRSLVSAWRQVKTALSHMRMNRVVCLRVVEEVLAREDRLPYSDLERLLPASVSIDAAVHDLELVDGVIFIAASPAGVALTSACRDRLNGLAENDRPC